MKKIQVIILSIIFPIITLAKDDFFQTGLKKGEGISNPFKAFVKDAPDSMNFGELVLFAINSIIKIATPILFVSLVFLGFKYIKALGNEKELDEVKKWTKWFFVGAIIILGANPIFYFISDTVKQLSI